MFNIARTVCVGFDPATVKNDHLPEGTVVPYGNSEKEKKKLRTLAEKYPKIEELDNIPLPGFTLYDVNKPKYTSTDSSWQVIDPRGFLVRISSKNLASILQVTGITEGLIQDKCVWARNDEKTEMVLVPVSSELYKDAVEGTELIETKVDINDVSIGDTVLLQNKLQGVYLGNMSLYCSMEYTNKKEFKVSKMIRRQVIEISPGKFHYNADAKILKIIKKVAKELTRQEAVNYINNRIATGNTYFTSSANINSGYYSNYGMVKFVSVHAAPKVKISLEKITKNEAEKLFVRGRIFQDNGNFIVEDSNGTKFTIMYPWHSSVRQFSVDEFISQEINEITDDSFTYRYSEQTSYFHYLNTSVPAKKLDSFVKFYKIVKHVKNDTYV